MVKLPDMPFVWASDPGPSDNPPRATDLDYVPAECACAQDGVRASLMDVDNTDEYGVVQAYISIEDEFFIENVEHYA